MAAYFLDSSAIVKRYAREAGTPWIMQITNRKSDNDLLVSLVAGAEVAAAIWRSARQGLMGEQAAAAAVAAFVRDFAGQYRVHRPHGATMPELSIAGDAFTGLRIRRQRFEPRCEERGLGC